MKVYIVKYLWGVADVLRVDNCIIEFHFLEVI